MTYLQVRRAALIVGAFMALCCNAGPALAWDRGVVQEFAVLPQGATGPEGIAVASDGQVFVGTFGFTTTGPVAGPGKIFVFDDNGRLLRTLTVGGSTAQLLGLGFNPNMSHVLLAVDFGAGNVRQVDPQSGASSVCITIPAPPAGVTAGLNALAFDSAGNTYISDSFQGIIFKKTGAGCGAAVAWVTSPLLQTTGVPPFGANGLQFNKAGNALLVANTGSDQIIRIPVTAGTPGTPAIYVNSINGADGLVIDRDDNIWVAANQSDEIVVLDPSGKAIAKLGDFDGLSKDGVPRGLLFPASPAFSRDRQWLYVTNLALDIRLFGLAQSPVSQWIAEVKRFTVSKIRARIPPLRERD
jgi:DNA-binding beta-propeller fold protein YncE